jgi:hypothetical protein
MAGAGGCFAIAFKFLSVFCLAIIVLLIVANPSGRIQRLERTLHLPNCGIFTDCLAASPISTLKPAQH